MGSPLPVILCGKTLKIGQIVAPALGPEIEVIHFISTPEAGKVQIPRLLKGEKDVPSDTELGSRNYENTPVAVILGGGYGDEDIELLREAAKGTKNVPWLRPDLTKSTLPLGPEYAKAAVARVKETMKELEEKGKLNEDSVVYY